jgi:hypothetical protein
MKTLKEFNNFNDSLKRMAAVMPNLSRAYLKQNERYHEALAFLAWCGYNTDEETIENIKEISETTPMDFNQAAHYYVNSWVNSI